eukprot:SAG31_NODE_282_length_18516_cov_9.338600_10_plen_771_part_00
MFSGIARVAEDHGLLYDVLIMDHPSVSSFNQLKSRLHRFRVAVLPVVMAMSEVDAELLASWVRAGGTLVAVDWSKTALFDEDYRPRPPCTAAETADCCRSAVLQSLLVRPGKGAVRVLFAELHRYAFKGFHDSIDDAAIAAAMTPFDMSMPILQSAQLPKTVWKNVWVHAGGPMRSVALVNYDGNATTNRLRPVNSSFNVTLRCCDNDVDVDEREGGQLETSLGCANISHASITRFDTKPTTVELPMTMTTPTDGCSFLHTHVPAYGITGALGVVVFSVDGEHQLRAAAAVARKELERLRIASRTKGLSPRARATQVAAVVAADLALRNVQRRRLTAQILSAGVSEFALLKLNLSAAVAAISTDVQAVGSAAKLATVQAARSSLVALAVMPPSAGDWQTLSPSQVFNASLGFGWVGGGVDGVLVSSPDASSTDALHGSFIGGHSIKLANEVQTLRIEIPGDRTSGVVTIISGSYDTSRQSSTTALRVEGAVPSGVLQLPGDYDFSGYYRHPSFRFDCTTGNRSLFISLFSDTHGDFYGDGYGQGMHQYTVVLNGVLVSGGRQAATKEGQAYLTLAEGLAATQLRRWMFVGPFFDPHFTSRGRILGPEASPVNYVDDTFDGGEGRALRWKTLETSGAVAAPRAMRMPANASKASFNRTVAFFFCTHVYVPPDPSAAFGVHAVPAKTMEVQLTGSTTALAEVYLNGKLVLNDRLVTGLLLQEFSRTLSLSCGQWNEVKVKVMQLSWASEWGMALSLHQVGSPRAVPGLKNKP